MDTVIVYYSMNGNTASVAQKIAVELHADAVEIQPANPGKNRRTKE